MELIENDLIKNDPEVIAIKEGLFIIENEADNIRIIDQETREAASAIRSQIKDIEKKLKLREDFFKKPAQEYVKNIISFFKYFSTKLETADIKIKQKQIADFEKLEKERIEEQKRLDTENELKRKTVEEEMEKNGSLKDSEAEMMLPNITPIVLKNNTNIRTEHGQTIFSKRWTFEIEISDKIPREYCIPSDKLINEAIKKGQRNIPGIKIFEETVTMRR